MIARCPTTFNHELCTCKNIQVVTWDSSDLIEDCFEKLVDYPTLIFRMAAAISFSMSAICLLSTFLSVFRPETTKE